MNNFEVALVKCFICGGDKELIMNTRLTPSHASTVKNAHGKAIDNIPCNECKELMKKGIILISVRDGESGNNPYRTGRTVVVRDNFIDIVANDKVKQGIMKHRIAYIPETTWKELGLPTN